MSYKSEVFKEVLAGFETCKFRDYCIDLLEARDDLNYSIPSSTSLKYHNATQCQPGGQIKHEIMVGTIMNYMLGLEYLQVKFDHIEQRECMRIAACLHDCKKTNGGKYTVHEHPVLGAEFIKNIVVEHDIEQKYKDYISKLIASHSGQWATSNRSGVELPKPDSDARFFVHLADYLSSRSNLDMIYSDEVNNLINNITKL